jgi:hypothetical protein
VLLRWQFGEFAAAGVYQTRFVPRRWAARPNLTRDTQQHLMALQAMDHNFCRRAWGAQTTPAQLADRADHQWSMEELVARLDHYDRIGSFVVLA